MNISQIPPFNLYPATIKDNERISTEKFMLDMGTVAFWEDSHREVILKKNNNFVGLAKIQLRENLLNILKKIQQKKI